MTSIVKIIKDKDEASFIVKCKDSVFAKNLSAKIYDLWEKVIENGKKRDHTCMTCMYAAIFWAVSRVTRTCCCGLTFE